MSHRHIRALLAAGIVTQFARSVVEVQSVGQPGAVVSVDERVRAVLAIPAAAEAQLALSKPGVRQRERSEDPDGTVMSVPFSSGAGASADEPQDDVAARGRSDRVALNRALRR